MSVNHINDVPNEILCTIFSYLDKKSLGCATVACKFWFEIIRADSKFSDHIILKKDGLNELLTKIENSEWKWERWPVLKTIELGYGNSHNYKGCPYEVFLLCDRLQNLQLLLT